MKVWVINITIAILAFNVHAQKTTDWHEMGLAGKVKYFKETSDELIKEVFFTENGFIDSAAYERLGNKFYDAFERDTNGYITERRYYINDSLIAHFKFDYNKDFSTGIQTETIKGNKAYISFNENGQEVKRVVDFNGNGPDSLDMKLFRIYNDNGRLIEDRNETTEGDLYLVNKFIYTYNLKGWTVKMIQQNITDMAQTVVNYEYFNFNVDKKSNWIFCERRTPGNEVTLSIVRQIVYYE